MPLSLAQRIILLFKGLKSFRRTKPFLYGVNHEMPNTNSARLFKMADQSKMVIAEGSFYLGGFIPSDADRQNILVMLEAPSFLSAVVGINRETLQELYSRGDSIPDSAWGLRRMYETIANDIGGGVGKQGIIKIANELLFLRNAYPDIIVYNQPEEWLRTAWYESDLLFYMLAADDEFRLYGALIYSDMDQCFAAYVRNHSESLNAMSGNNCLLLVFDGEMERADYLRLNSKYVAYKCIVSRLGRFEGTMSAAELDEMINAEKQMLMDVSRFNRSILFGRQVGVKLVDTPCIVFWDDMHSGKICVCSFKDQQDNEQALRDQFKRVLDSAAEEGSTGLPNVLARIQDRLTGIKVPVEESILDASVCEQIAKFLIGSSKLGNCRLYIDDIEEFEKVRKVTPNMVSGCLDEYGVVNISESELKTTLEEILNIAVHKTDWGGEINDLYTTNITIGGNRISAAFLLKGPGIKKSKLHISDCGKNGDQILRLFDSPAELFVIQFVGYIQEDVIRDIEGKVNARRLAKQRAWYMIIDGQETARLLFAYRMV